VKRRLCLFRRPATGQMVFWFVLAPTPSYWSPPETSQRARPTPRRNYHRVGPDASEANADPPRTIVIG
jgi:hypothetical protein